MHVRASLKQFEFRLANVADAHCIGKLAQQVFGETDVNHHIREDLIDEVKLNYDSTVFEQRIRKSSCRFVLVEALGELVAFSECESDPQPPTSSLLGGAELACLYCNAFSVKVLGVNCCLKPRNTQRVLHNLFCGLLLGLQTTKLAPSIKHRAIQMLAFQITPTKERSFVIAFTKKYLRVFLNS